MISDVFLSRKAQRQLKKIPTYIGEAFWIWVDTIGRIGIRETRALKGYHDEPLKGDRFGQRSARLSNAYRVIYLENERKIIVLEVTKHDY